MQRAQTRLRPGQQFTKTNDPPQTWDLHGFFIRLDALKPNANKMLIETIVRSRGGTEERSVSIDEIVIPAVPELTPDLIDNQWIEPTNKLHRDVKSLVTAFQNEKEPSAELFVPNYWKAAIKLPPEMENPMLELWHLAHDLGKETVYIRDMSVDSNDQGVRGILYVLADRGYG